jgi:hypothetical protein
MRPMEHPTASQSSTPDRSAIGRHRTQADADTHERDPQIRSLTMPGLAKGPILPEWLRKLFRRTDTPAAN